MSTPRFPRLPGFPAHPSVHVVELRLKSGAWEREFGQRSRGEGSAGEAGLSGIDKRPVEGSVRVTVPATAGRSSLEGDSMLV